MPKKSRRHSTAPDAYWHTEGVSIERCNLGMLWLRVVEQVWRDCHDIDNNDIYKAREAESALVWVIENNRDFDAVCGLADIDPKHFRSKIIASISERYSRRLLTQVFARHFKPGAKQRNNEGD